MITHEHRNKAREFAAIFGGNGLNENQQVELAAAELAKTGSIATGTEANVCVDISRRQAHGRAKYGTTVAENPLTLREWLQHAYEETLDKAVYLKRAIAEIDAGGGGPQIQWTDLLLWIDAQARMNDREHSRGWNDAMLDFRLKIAGELKTLSAATAVENPNKQHTATQSNT